MVSTCVDNSCGDKIDRVVYTQTKCMWSRDAGMPAPLVRAAEKRLAWSLLHNTVIRQGLPLGPE